MHKYKWLSLKSFQLTRSEQSDEIILPNTKMVLNESTPKAFLSESDGRTAQCNLWPSFFFLLVLVLLYKKQNYFRAVILALKLPGPPLGPYFNNFSLIARRDVLSKVSAGVYGLYGTVLRLWVVIFPFFAVMDPADIQVILSSRENTNKVWFYRLIQSFIGNGLITSGKEEWQYHRRLLQPTFHLKVLERFIGIFADAAQVLNDTFDPLVDKDINLCDFITECIVNVQNEAVLGVPIKKKSTDPVMEASPFRQGQLMLGQRCSKPWLLFDGIFRLTSLASSELSQKSRLNKFTRDMIKVRQAVKLKQENFQSTCLLDFMIDIAEKNPDFTEEDIINEASTFMLAGQDSVASSLAITLFLLAQNPECQAKCQAELEDIFGDDNRAPTMQDLRQMQYLEMCIKESLRLYPAVPLYARTLGQDVHLKSHTLPAGSMVFILPYSAHRLPYIFPDPEKFDPERFSPKALETLHPYAFLAFSAGPRNCIGHRFAILQMKTIISRMLRSYHIEPVPGKTTFEPIYRISLRASGGTWVRLRSKTISS